MKAVRAGTVGKVRLVYAEMEDGMVPREHYHEWKTVNGVPWPAKDEFETGCTYEHAGYHLGILAQIFGPAEHMASYARCLLPDKAPDLGLEKVSPDFSIGCISYAEDVVARIACGIVGPADRSLTIVGDLGYWFWRTSGTITRPSNSIERLGPHCRRNTIGSGVCAGCCAFRGRCRLRLRCCL